MSSLDYFYIVIILFFIIVIFSFWKKINHVCRILDEVSQGNFNQRVRFQNHIKILNKLSIKVNNLIEKLQKVEMNNKQNEESRKRMISNISHDLRTPLTSMLGYMELIIDDNAIDNEEKMKYLKVVYNKGIYLHNLMEEFFQISKLDSNDFKLNIKKINLSEIIRQNIVLFFYEIKKLNIEIKINIPEDDVFVFADEKALIRIFSNLINNAVKHGSKATQIGIELSSDDKKIYIDIYDNGIGIQEDEISYIFDRLYTIEKSRKLNMKNSGLGLTIVKRLIEILGGSISVSSVPFEKTVFTVTLPIK